MEIRLEIECLRSSPLDFLLDLEQWLKVKAQGQDIKEYSVSIPIDAEVLETNQLLFANDTTEDIIETPEET